MVFEILGVNLLEIIKRYDYKGVPLQLARIIAKQCLMGLDYLHRVCQLIHTDLKPENVILNLSPDELKEIKQKGYLTTTNVYNLPEKIKNLLSFNVYDPRNKWRENHKKEENKWEPHHKVEHAQSSANLNMEGLTKKQKKNLKKKLWKQKKKQ